MYDRPNRPSSGCSLTLAYGDLLSNIDCHSMALNDQETHLLLVGNHSIAFVNLETIVSPMDAIGDDVNMILPYPPDIKLVSLFDTCNVNRPIVEWSHFDTNQYAVAIDRIVRLYTVDHARIQETSSVIDTQHQRPISTLTYRPRESGCILTGSLDGQVQVWDTRHCSAKAPAVLRVTMSTPFSIRRILWPSTKSDGIIGGLSSTPYQLAVQCDRSVRIYDMRRMDAYVDSIDLDHSQRLVDMDWTMQSRSIVTLSLDHSLRVFSTTGQLLNESVPNESPYAMSKIRATASDSLFVSASRDTEMSTFGFVGWIVDDDQHLRPLTDRIVSSTPSPVLDFSLVTSSRLLQLLSNPSSSRLNDPSTDHFLLLAWCRDEHLRLIDMDSTFRHAWLDHRRVEMARIKSQTNETLYPTTMTRSNITRQQQSSRSSIIQMGLESIKDELTDGADDDDDDNDNAFRRIDSPPPPDLESPETDDENDVPILPTNIEVSIQNEMNSLLDKYGPYIVVELKDEQRRLCIVRCIYSLDGLSSFRIYLLLSRHYPIIAQLSIRFKLSSIIDDDRSKLLRQHIQRLFDETSNICFYRGQLCLHVCLFKLKHLIDVHYKQERSTANAMAHATHKKRDESVTSFDPDSPGIVGGTTGHFSNSNNNNSNTMRMFGQSSSSTRTSDSQMSLGSFAQMNRRTCGARFAGGTHLVCFGRTPNLQPPGSAPVLSGMGDATVTRPQSLPMRSTSLVVVKSRGSSSTDEQPASYRPPTTTTTVHIQNVPASQRSTIFSAPVRSSYTAGVIGDHQRISTSSASYRRHLATSAIPCSTVSIYDVSILLPVSCKLADEYRLDLSKPKEMCEINEQITAQMGKDELAHCWHLLGGLLSLQSHFSSDNTWFQTPIAQGLIKHLVSHYVAVGDIQSASMFLLTMSKTNFTSISTKKSAEDDPILYAYASLLHRWKHFYKRTQILSRIDHNCQSPAPINSASTTIICSICLQPVIGQHFMCALCGHGGHLTHMHEWFSSTEIKHRYCPEKDCSCPCIIRQQEVLTMNNVQIQPQHTPTLTPRPSPYISRQPSGTGRPT